jgi:hypothetical protein
LLVFSPTTGQIILILDYQIVIDIITQIKYQTTADEEDQQSHKNEKNLTTHYPVILNIQFIGTIKKRL